jgi:hypothetical protein
MTIRDLAEVTWTITRLDITARDMAGAYLHRWIIGEKEPFVGHGKLLWDIAAGRASDIAKKINVHNNKKGNGQPEMGWGLDLESIPAELLDAEITRLGMRCRDGIEYEVYVDISLPDLAVEMVKSQLEPYERVRGEETV